MQDRVTHGINVCNGCLDGTGGVGCGDVAVVQHGLDSGTNGNKEFGVLAGCEGFIDNLDGGIVDYCSQYRRELHRVVAILLPESMDLIRASSSMDSTSCR